MHVAAHWPHLMHFAGSITCGCFTVPEIAPTGHFFAHIVQPLHFAGSIEYVFSAAHSCAGQRASRMWASYSSRK